MVPDMAGLLRENGGGNGADTPFARRARAVMRAALGTIYALLTLISAGAIAHAPAGVVALVGLRAALIMGTITGLAAVICAFSVTFHLWLLERGVVFFAFLGTAAYSAVLWVGVSQHISGVDSAGFITITSLILLIRLLQLELFASQQPRPPGRVIRRRNKGR